MTEILAVFRSRSQAVDAAAKMKSAGINAGITNTPRETGFSCGLSVKFFGPSLPKVRQILSHSGYSAFSGYFAVFQSGGRKIYKKL